MWLIRHALRRPVTAIVFVLAALSFGLLALRGMPLDIFPRLGAPVVYVAQPYGGLSPAQMEGFITSYYEYHFLYVTGIKEVESKSIQGAALLKLRFHDGTNMNQAMAEVVGYVTRARAFMPPGTVGPFIVRYDAGSAPVGQLVLRSESRSVGEIQDLALFRVRPMFAALEGVSAPPPFGGSQRTVVVHVDPERMRGYGLTPDAIVQTIAKGNAISPAGNVRIGDYTLITNTNSVVDDISGLTRLPVKVEGATPVLLGDVATVENGSDISTSYALVNGRRSVYIEVTKRSDASTWDVVKRVRAALPSMQAAVPADIHISYEFDQSGYVLNALRSLLFEALLGTILTGGVVFLFLRDWRSATIVVVTIPVALLTAAIGLDLAGQSLNVMTLSGLALAVGILVDEATVTVENITRHIENGERKGRAILDASREILVPKFLILIAVLAVFAPAAFMSGTPRAMFFPLALAVGLAMTASFVLSQTLVPVMANWMFVDAVDMSPPRPSDARTHDARKLADEQRMRGFLVRSRGRVRERGGAVLTAFVVAIVLVISVGYRVVGTEIFPRVDHGQFQLRLRAAPGTRVEVMEQKTLAALALIRDVVGPSHIAITSAFIGSQPSSYPINTIFLWTSGPQEAVLLVKPPDGDRVSLEETREKLRAAFAKRMPELSISFEPGDLVDQVMAQGANNPIEVAIIGRDLAADASYAESLRRRLADRPSLRDVAIVQPLRYPSLDVTIDRLRAGILGSSASDITQSLVAATSSSRFTQPNYWLDTKTGTAYQVQVDVPQAAMSSVSAVEQIPVRAVGDSRLMLGDVATLKTGTTVGEYDRLNQQRFLTITANVHDRDVGGAAAAVRSAIAAQGALPAGVTVRIRGQVELMEQMFSELRGGLLLAVFVIFLLLAGAFQSFRLGLVVLFSAPAVVAGSMIALLLTRSTLNIQSYMGMIMSLGVSAANAILLVTAAESARGEGLDVHSAAERAADLRLRPILMTTLAMLAGMLPLAVGLGEGGEQTAPLGIAVIGGLIASTATVLLLLPAVYELSQRNVPVRAMSLDPDDPRGIYAAEAIR
ncbi:MAG: efflux RND transporter permease subunit [Gemmatimonadaceae bacterium]